jgi:hypothetical protein
MALQDWISKYPKVHELIQQDTDILEGATTEDAPEESPPPATTTNPRYRAWVDTLPPAEQELVPELPTPCRLYTNGEGQVVGGGWDQAFFQTLCRVEDLDDWRRVLRLLREPEEIARVVYDVPASPAEPAYRQHIRLITPRGALWLIRWYSWMKAYETNTGSGTEFIQRLSGFEEEGLVKAFNDGWVDGVQDLRRILQTRLRTLRMDVRSGLFSGTPAELLDTITTLVATTAPEPEYVPRDDAPEESFDA